MVVVEIPGTDVSYYVDNKLKHLLDKNVTASLHKKDKDFVLVIDGNEGCLAGDTLIQVSRGKVSRKHTIKSLYNNYHNISNGNGNKFNKSILSFIRAFNGKEIRLHKIKDVSYSGKKMTYTLQLETKSIKATSNHKFLTREGWKELKNIKKGDELMCDNLHPQKSERKRVKLYDIMLTATYHPSSNKKHRVEVHRLIYEARLNGLGFIEFIDILLNEPEKSKTLKYVDTNIYLIHHKDGCHYNNSIQNLVQIKKEEHLKYHGINGGYANFSQGSPIFQKVISITKNIVEEVYDIACEEPHHNFIANGIIVHNSGKSWFGFQVGRYIDNTLDLPRVCFTANQFREAIFKAKKGECVIYDEAFTGLSSRAAMTSISRMLISLMMQMRQKNLFVIVVLPTIYLLDKYVASFRASALLHVFEVHGERGYFTLYNRKLIKKLYKKDVKTYSYKTKSGFRGRFYGKFALGGEDVEKEYRRLKEQALQEVEIKSKDEIPKYLEQRNFTWFLLKLKTKKTNKEIVQWLADGKFPVQEEQYGAICREYRLKEEK